MSILHSTELPGTRLCGLTRLVRFLFSLLECRSMINGVGVALLRCAKQTRPQTPPLVGPPFRDDAAKQLQPMQSASSARYSQGETLP